MRDVVDRLIDHAALRHDRLNSVCEPVEAHDVTRLRHLGRLSGEDRRFAGESARPIDDRARGNDQDSEVIDEDADASPVEAIGEGPFRSVEVAPPDLEAMFFKERLDAIPHRCRITLDVDVHMERNGVDLHRAIGREPSRDHFRKGRGRHRHEHEPDRRQIPDAVVNVVEVHSQNRPRDRRRIRGKIRVGTLVLLDDDADQRQDAPEREQRNAKGNVAEGSQELRRERVGHVAVRLRACHDRSSTKISQIEIS